MHLRQSQFVRKGRKKNVQANVASLKRSVSELPSDSRRDVQER